DNAIPSIVSVPTLIETLSRCQLLTGEQKDECVRELQRRFADHRELTKELLRRGWITPFQVNQLFQGRGPQLVLGHYLLLERLGEGGTGQIFKARHLVMQRIVALKIIRKELLADNEVVGRFFREIQLVSQLAHPNVISAYDAGPVGQVYFL